VVARRYYFNYSLFVPIRVARRVIDIFRIALKSKGDVNSPFLNPAASTTIPSRACPVAAAMKVPCHDHDGRRQRQQRRHLLTATLAPKTANAGTSGK
jgi:hypothetical protein